MPALHNFQNDCIRRVVVGGAMAWALLLPSVAGAQTLGAVEHRLDRLEKDVRQIEEHQADHRTRSSNAEDAYLQFDRRLDAIEQTIAALVAAQERDHNELASVTEQLRRMKGDVDARLDAVENRPPTVSLPQPDNRSEESESPALDADGRFNQAMGYAAREDWTNAEFAFETFIASYPSDERTAVARYQLGRALQSQGKHPQAAQIFLTLYEQHPDAPFAVENLFALGAALSAMGPDSAQRACDVYSEIEAGHGSNLSIDQRSQLLDRRLALHCAN